MFETETLSGTKKCSPETATKTGSGYDLSTETRTVLCTRKSDPSLAEFLPDSEMSAMLSEPDSIGSLSIMTKPGVDTSSSVWGRQEVAWTKRYSGRWDDPFATSETRSGTYDPDEGVPREVIDGDEDADRRWIP